MLNDASSFRNARVPIFILPFFLLSIFFRSATFPLVADAQTAPVRYLLSIPAVNQSNVDPSSPVAYAFSGNVSVRRARGTFSAYQYPIVRGRPRRTLVLRVPAIFLQAEDRRIVVAVPTSGLPMLPYVQYEVSVSGVTTDALRNARSVRVPVLRFITGAVPLPPAPPPQGPPNNPPQNPPSDPQLITLSDFKYQGAFRVPANQFGISSMNYSEGPLAWNPANNSFFFVGHNWEQAIVEFQKPALVNSVRLSDLNFSGNPLQTFAPVLGRASGGNPQGINTIGGLGVFTGPSGPELLVNAYTYYDAPGQNTHTTLALRNANNIAASTVSGYFTFQGGAGHTSGWISPVPSEWQSSVGGSYITGQSSGIPIISRTSVGPSAFAFNPFDIVGNPTPPNPVPTVKLLDFSLDNPLHTDLSNDSGQNNLWTHLSRAVYGYVVPGSRTYATFGHSGGHRSGVCYKCTPQGASEACGGYCPNQSGDQDLYYWLWDVNDLLAVKRGEKESYEIRPYEYGIFPAKFSATALGGGTFDPVSGILYLTEQRADDEQGQYANPPVVVGYTVAK